MKILLLMLVSTSLMAGVAVDSGAAYQINRDGAVNRKYSIGTLLHSGHWLKGQYSFAVDGGAANATITLKDSEGVAVKIPNNAIVKDCLIDVITVPTSSTSSSKISFNSNAVGDLKASAAIYPTYQTADTAIACIPTGGASTAIKLASEGELKISIGSEALTAGKINVWIEYTLSD